MAFQRDANGNKLSIKENFTMDKEGVNGDSESMFKKWWWAWLILLLVVIAILVWLYKKSKK